MLASTASSWLPSGLSLKRSRVPRTTPLWQQQQCRRSPLTAQREVPHAKVYKLLSQAGMLYSLPAKDC